MIIRHVNIRKSKAVKWLNWSAQCIFLKRQNQSVPAYASLHGCFLPTVQCYLAIYPVVRGNAEAQNHLSCVYVARR